MSTPLSANDEAVKKLADELWSEMLSHSPIWGTYLGIEVDDGALDDTSDAARLRDRAMWEKYGKAAASISDDGLDIEWKITRDLMRVGSEIAIERDDLRLDLLSVVDHMDGVQTMLPQLAAFQDAKTPEKFAKLISRLKAFPKFMDGCIERVVEAERRGLTASKISTERLIAQIEGLMKIPATESPIVTAANVAGDAERAELANIVAEYVDPQIKRYYDVVAGSYRGKARQEPGLSSAPNGAELYRAAIHGWTGLHLDPKELHEIGMQEWAEIQEEMKVIATKLGYDGSIEKLRDAAESDSTNVAATKEALIVRIKEDIERGYAAAGKVFGRFPKAGCDVKAVEQFKEKDAPAAYYFSPAADGSRPGTYYVNGYDLPSRFLHALAPTTYHEAIPGHHFQIALEMELEFLPNLRKHASHLAGNAYVEGWGLYSERLADELGLYRNEMERFGMLQGQAHRAARLVVDTGIHAFGWTRDRGVEFMESVGLPRTDAEIETDRYIAWPAQALCYKVGQRAIQRTRKAIELRDGDKFDIKAFHDHAIGHGQIPLLVFEAEMPNWVKPKA